MSSSSPSSSNIYTVPDDHAPIDCGDDEVIIIEKDDEHDIKEDTVRLDVGAPAKARVDLDSKSESKSKYKSSKTRDDVIEKVRSIERRLQLMKMRAKNLTNVSSSSSSSSSSSMSASLIDLIEIKTAIQQLGAELTSASTATNPGQGNKLQFQINKYCVDLLKASPLFIYHIRDPVATRNLNTMLKKFLDDVHILLMNSNSYLDTPYTYKSGTVTFTLSSEEVRKNENLMCQYLTFVDLLAFMKLITLVEVRINSTSTQATAIRNYGLVHLDMSTEGQIRLGNGTPRLESVRLQENDIISTDDGETKKRKENKEVSSKSQSTSLSNSIHDDEYLQAGKFGFKFQHVICDVVPREWTLEEKKDGVRRMTNYNHNIFKSFELARTYWFLRGYLLVDINDPRRVSDHKLNFVIQRFDQEKGSTKEMYNYIHNLIDSSLTSPHFQWRLKQQIGFIAQMNVRHYGGKDTITSSVTSVTSVSRTTSHSTSTSRTSAASVAASVTHVPPTETRTLFTRPSTTSSKSTLASVSIPQRTRTRPSRFDIPPRSIQRSLSLSSLSFDAVPSVNQSIPQQTQLSFQSQSQSQSQSSNSWPLSAPVLLAPTLAQFTQLTQSPWSFPYMTSRQIQPPQHLMHQYQSSYHQSQCHYQYQYHPNINPINSINSAMNQFPISVSNGQTSIFVPITPYQFQLVPSHVSTLSSPYLPPLHVFTYSSPNLNPTAISFH